MKASHFVYFALLAALIASLPAFAQQQEYLYPLNYGKDYVPGERIGLAYETQPSAGALHVQVFSLSLARAAAIDRQDLWRIDPRDFAGERIVSDFESSDRLASPNANAGSRLVNL
ncbi:MAG TPA: hypothetical protein VKR05_02525, partial [Candidatus Cybelea sp.]|nr:hypothetical protein [Candidatus Cybelea sp.]